MQRGMHLRVSLLQRRPIYMHRGMHLFAALPRMLPILIDIAIVDLSDEARGILTKTKPRVKLEHTLANANIDRTCTRYA